jgi:hypothetical protein
LLLQKYALPTTSSEDICMWDLLWIATNTFASIELVDIMYEPFITENIPTQVYVMRDLQKFLFMWFNFFIRSTVRTDSVEINLVLIFIGSLFSILFSGKIIRILIPKLK